MKNPSVFTGFRGAARRAADPGTKKASARACFFFALHVLACAPAFGHYPPVRSLSNADPVFRQLSADVEDSRQRQSAPGSTAEAEAAALTVYEYETREGDDLFALAARCGVPYETIATANRLPAGGTLAARDTVLIPAAPGLFVPESPGSDLEMIVAAARPEGAESATVTLRLRGSAVRFRFFPGAQFTPTERAFFLNVAFRLPLPSARVTSSFGLRRNPVTGTLKRHAGIDLAAPEGTEVYATRDGVVAELGYDPVYGNFVVLEHEGAWKSLYGHLSEILTDLRKTVRSGTIVGRVGSTGQSTGPHLHFELRRNGEARDPAALIPRGIGR